jgi:hypothetical protein|tara:strand:+ start:1283 stop:1744 length:462 start_codon:yes stop_codon:yes gene_type:complete
MTTRNRNGSYPVDTAASRINANYDNPEAEAGFAKSIGLLTSAGQTIFEVLSRTRFSDEEGPIMAAAVHRGYMEASDPESPFSTADFNNPLDKVKRPLPASIVWFLAQAHAKLSEGGYNADRVATMHVQPAMMPAQLLERPSRTTEAVERIRNG